MSHRLFYFSNKSFNKLNVYIQKYTIVNESFKWGGARYLINIEMLTEQLYIGYRCLNEAFYANELPEVAITIQSSGKRESMGWCSREPIWRNDTGSIRLYEINIAAEFLNIEFYETMSTLHHVMIHLYCKVNGIQDVSRSGQYHNKRFKKECLLRGFYFASNKPDKRLGWSFALLTEEAKRIIDTFPIDRELFQIARKTYGRIKSPEDSKETEEKQQPRSHIRKYVCPSCSCSVRASKEVHIRCEDCQEPMIWANPPEQSA